MSLPSGYTRLDYIESSGTQYINTGFKPNQNTRVMMDVEVLGTTQCAPFGARASQGGNITYTLFLLTATTGRTDYGASRQEMTFSSILGRYTIDANKNVVNVNGVSITHTASTFSVDHNIFLLAVNTAGTASNFAKMKLYSAKIYDNGMLVRDFIPCKNASGTLGLWDNVNSVFYANAGTGTFSTGKKHKTMIDGTGCEIKSGRVLIAGTGYDIKKGRTLIGGTGYDIRFGTPVAEIAVGTSVYMNVNGVRKEWIIVHQGKPADLYDDTCFGTWVMLKDIYASVSRGTTYYYFGTRGPNGSWHSPCEHDTYLTDTFFPLLDTEIQGIVKTANIPDISYSSTYEYTAPRKIFLASWAELGSAYWYQHDPTPLKYFEADTDKKRIAYIEANGKRQPYTWALRDCLYRSNDGNGLFLPQVDVDGKKITMQKFNTGVRPLLILSQTDAKSDDDFNIIPA